MFLIRFLRAQAVLAALALPLAGCLSSSDSAPDPDPGGPGNGDISIDLPGVSLAEDQVDPLGRVEVLGLPEGAEASQVHAVIEATDVGGQGFSVLDEPAEMLLIADGDAIWMLTPLVDADGATIRLRITDGELFSDTLELTLAPLPPPRAGAAEDLRVALDDLLRATTEGLGLDYPDEWVYWRDQRFPSSMPEHFAPLARGWLAIADPENPQSWVNQAFDEESVELLERILARIPLIEIVNERAAFARGGGGMLASAAELTSVATATVTRLPPANDLHNVQVSKAELQSAAPRWELTGTPPIFTVDELAPMLETYTNARDWERDLELFDDTVGAYLSAVATLGSIKAGPGGAALISEGRRRAISALGNAASVLGRTADVAQWFLPCCITDLDVIVDPPGGYIEFEDASPNQVQLVSATARAESIEVDLTREIMDHLLSKLAGSLEDAVLNPLVEEIYRDTATGVIMDFSVSGDFETWLDQFPPGLVAVFAWEDIDLRAEDPRRWLEHEITTLDGSGTPILEQAPNLTQHEYEFRLVTPAAFERQDSLLRFLTNTEELRAPVAIDTVQIQLETIEIEFSPTRARVTEPGEEVTFTVTVHNAVNLGIQIPPQVTPDIGTLSPATAVADGVYEFTWTAPDEGLGPDDIVEIRTWATTTRGIRHEDHDPPERSGTIFISSEEPTAVTIEPWSACLEGGETQQFLAQSPLTGDPVEVEWSTDLGQISSAGLYSAPPDVVDEATVTATPVASPEEAVSVTFTVGACDCWWSGRVTGDTFATVTSDTLWIEYDEASGEYNDLRFFGPDEDTSDPTQLRLDIQPPLQRGDTGNYSAAIGPTVNFFSGLGLSDTPQGLALEIAESGPAFPQDPEDEGIRLVGSIHGPVTFIQDNEQRSGQLDIRFRGQFWFPVPFSDALNCSP